MSEAEIIAASGRPNTRTSLASDFARLGVTGERPVLVHSSLRSLGWVAGGAQAVIEALLDAIGPAGTLVMPAHSSDWTDPVHWQAPPVPADWIPIIREQMPPYDPERTPTRGMGWIAELFRTWPDVRRSSHPAASFAAIGPLADLVIRDHALESTLGERSPLGRLYEHDADILLIGVGFDRCTMLHLAEQRVWPERPAEQQGAAILVNGERRWVEYRTPATLDAEAFLPMGERMLAAGLVRAGMAGLATCRLLKARQAVDFAVEAWTGTQPPA